jgi:hypothetical protein
MEKREGDALMAKTDERLFAPFPIEMDEHPKIAPLSDKAFRALFEATFYSRRMLSDGFLDGRIVLKRWGRKVADELSSNDPHRPSWIPVEGGWQIHDFEKHHPVRADIEAGRERRSQANRANGKRSGEQRRTNAERNANEIERNRTPETETETETDSTPKGVDARKRAPTTGKRINESFEVTPEMVAWASTNAPLVNGKRATEMFINHWTSKSGRDAAKKDWPATWRNWLLKDQETAENRRAAPAKQTPEERLMATLALAADIDMKGIES